MKTKDKLSKTTLKHFTGSGLTNADAKIMQIREISREELLSLFPKIDAPEDDSVVAHAIPYFDIDGDFTKYVRFRLHFETVSGAKYLQQAGAKSRFYLPPFTNWREVALNSNIPIYITEGERKAAKACRSGFPCIGLGGVWNWLSKEAMNQENTSQAIKDFQLFNWKNRKVYIVFDSDAQFNTNVQAAIRKLRDTLVGLGADPYRVDLPHKAGENKVGLDDFLCSRNGIKQFFHLPKVPLLLNKAITATELLKQKFSPRKYIVQGLIPFGLSIIAGPPKCGKSWLVLQMMLAIAAGKKALGHYETMQSECIYLALEDTRRRLQERVTSLCQAGLTVNDLSAFAHEWERVENGGLEVLERTFQQNPNCKVMIIDTFAKMRRTPRGKENLYHQDYDAVSALKRIADKYEAAIIVVHHTKKGSSDDYLESVSGSMGITGASDTVMVLRRTRNEGQGVLQITGRDIEEQAIALGFEHGLWTYKGEASTVNATECQQEVLALMVSEGRPLRQKEIADLLGRRNEGFTKTLARMVRQDLVKRENNLYTPAVPQEGQQHKFTRKEDKQA